VAIIDSGIDANHPHVGALSGCASFVYDEDAPDSVRVDDGLHDDLFGHGTACAGIVRSLAPNAEIWSLRVLGEQLTGKARVFARALEWAIEHEMHVVNLSLSTSNDDWYGTFQDLCDRASFARIMIVCALANEPKASYPSQFSSVFSVAAAEDRDVQKWWRNPHAPAEWGAPGIDIDIAWLDRATINATGNSFAAPHLAGHLARLVEMHPGIAAWQAKTVMAELAANAG
jgi:subtilisin family serine protease